MRIKKNLILKEATEIKGFIEKNKKLPLSCTLDNTQLSVYSTCYLMCAALEDKFKSDNYNLSPVIIYNSTRLSDTINEKVYKEDYLKMVRNFVDYCHDHRHVPSYITTQKSKTKVSFELFTYCVSKIANYYKENKTLPNYCLFNKSDLTVKQTTTKNTKTRKSSSTSTNKKTNNCTNPYTSTPHLMDDNMGQDTGYGCANNAEQQEFYKLTGKIFKESELAKLSGTTTKGTDHQGINTCIAAIGKKLGIKLTVKWVNFSDLGNTIEERFEALAKIICQPNKGVITHIAYMNGGEEEFNPKKKSFGHYEPIRQIDVKAKTVQVLNSLGYKRADGGYKGHLQKRSFKVEASYLRNTPGGQPSICIITKG